MATHNTRTVCIPPRVLYGMETNFYMVLYDLATGNLVNAATGVLSVSTSWVNAAFVATDHWTAHSITGYPVISIPALETKKTYAYLCFDNISPVITDIPTRCGLYSAETGSFYGSDIPTYGGQVSITPRHSGLGQPQMGM